MLTLEEMQNYRQAGYKTAPLLKSYYADDLTPFTALKKMKAQHENVFLLESATTDQQLGRYSFIGADPKLEVTLTNGNLSIKSKREELYQTNDQVFEAIQDLLDRYQAPRIEGYPPLTGGLVGYFAYEFYQYRNPEMAFDQVNADGLPDMDLMVFTEMICFDHYRQQLLLVATVDLDEDLEASYQEALDKLEDLEDLLQAETPALDGQGRMTSDLKAHYDKESFIKMVERAQAEIAAGDLDQVVLSNYLKADFEGSLLDTYRALRSINPSPYMVYFSSPDIEIAGASPETLASLTDGLVKTYPLAGTAKRGKTGEADRLQAESLLSDPKEIAEHELLVKTSLQDLEAFCQPNSIQVESSKEIVRYSHVMHIESVLSGQLAEGRNALDVIRYLLPAGTLSGEPKDLACQLIQEIEGDRRDIYGGAIGYIDFTGDMDTCIAIRLAFVRNKELVVRAGAGIIAESQPEKEYEECLNKSMGTLQALEEQEGLSGLQANKF